MCKQFFILLLLTGTLFAESEWLNSCSEAKAKALKEQKNIMLMLSKEECDACWYMQNIVFLDAKVEKLLNDNFVLVYLDVEEDDIPEKYSYIGTPTFYFTDSKGKRIGRKMSGASNVKEFTSRVHTVLEEAKN